MNTQSTLEQLQQLKLTGMVKCYRAILEQPVHQQPEPHLLIGILADAEARHRLIFRTDLYLRMSKLRYHALPEQVNCSDERGLSKTQFLQLCEGGFVTQGDNVLITGATGCGKSYLACALGRKACMLGYRTIYYSMNRFIEALATARLEGTYIKWLNMLAKMPVLVLDDFGLKEMDHNTRLALLQILEDRYRKGSTIITSQLPVGKWYDYINEPTFADAILDRLTAHAHKIDLKGKSLRNVTLV
jgi:DNA replication protein DnaC